MDKKKELSQIEQLIQTAKESKHCDAILLLSEKKEYIASIVRETFKNLEKAKQEIPDEIKKVISLFCETIYQECIRVLGNDKK